MKEPPSIAPILDVGGHVSLSLQEKNPQVKILTVGSSFGESHKELAGSGPIPKNQI